MIHELRYALRVLAKSPAFTLIAIATLALAIGANTAVISLVNALLVRPLPYRAPQQLVLLLQHFKAQNLDRIPVSPPEYVDYETRVRGLEKIGAFTYANFNLAGGEMPERISGARCFSKRASTPRRQPDQGAGFRSGRSAEWTRRRHRNQRAPLATAIQQRSAHRGFEGRHERPFLHHRGHHAERLRFSTAAFQSRLRWSIRGTCRHLAAARLHGRANEELVTRAGSRSSAA